jgi:hypothetical protein
MRIFVTSLAIGTIILLLLYKFYFSPHSSPKKLVEYYVLFSKDKKRNHINNLMHPEVIKTIQHYKKEHPNSWAALENDIYLNPDFIERKYKLAYSSSKPILEKKFHYPIKPEIFVEIDFHSHTDKNEKITYGYRAVIPMTRINHSWYLTYGIFASNLLK